MFLQYEEKLNKLMSAPIIVGTILFVIALVVIFFIFKFGAYKDKSVKISLVAMALLFIFIYFVGVFPYQLDIKQQSYEKYTGEFYVESYYFVTKSGTYIKIKRPQDDKPVRYKTTSGLGKIEENTTYNGYFVIAKHSKTVVDLQLD